MKAFLILFAGILSAGAQAKQVVVALACEGDKNVANLKLTMLRVLDTETKKDLVRLNVSILGKWGGGVEEKELKVVKGWESDLDIQPSPYFTLKDASNNFSLLPVGASLRNPDRSIPGAIISMRLETKDEMLPFLEVKGVVGPLRSGTVRNMNATVFVGDAEKSLGIGNDDFQCAYLVK